MSKPESFGTSSANQTSPVLSFNAKPPVGIARRAGRSPSAARKLPKQKPRSPRGMTEMGKPFKGHSVERGDTTSPAGSSGGSAEGASEGRQPLTGPHLPPAAQAAQIKSSEKAPAPAGRQKSYPKGQALPLSLPLSLPHSLPAHCAISLPRRGIPHTGASAAQAAKTRRLRR